MNKTKDVFWGFGAQSFAYSHICKAIRDNGLAFSKVSIGDCHIGDDDDRKFHIDFTLAAKEFLGTISIDAKGSAKYPCSCSISKNSNDPTDPFFENNKINHFFLPVFHDISKLYLVRAAKWLLDVMEEKKSNDGKLYYLLTKKHIECNYISHKDDIFEINIFDSDKTLCIFNVFMDSFFKDKDYVDFANISDLDIVPFIKERIHSRIYNVIFNDCFDI